MLAAPERDDLDQVVPFASLFAPLVAAARPVPDGGGLLAPTARRDLADQLLGRLAEVGAGAARAAFGPPGDPTSDRRYRTFVRSGLPAVLSGAPVLEELLAGLVARWEDATAELADRLVADRRDVADLLGEPADGLVVVEVRGPLGDPHGGGRSVLGLRTVAGGEVMAKPRPVDGEVALAAVVDALDATGAPWPGAPTTAAVARPTHGWALRVAEAPVSDPVRWWERAGAVLALAHVGGAADLHHGNVVATASGPVLVDLECLGLADLAIPDGGPARPTWVLRESVAATGLLPGTYRTSGPTAVDLAGFSDGAERGDGSFGDAWVGLGTDAIGTERRRAVVPASPNRGCDGEGTAIPVDLDALLRGLDITLAALARHPDVTAPFADLDGSRLILRSTATYDAALGRAVTAEALGSPDAFRAAVALPPWGPPEQVALGDRAARVDAVESAALARLDVPIHRSRGRDLALDDGSVLADVIARPWAVRAGERRTPGTAERRAQGEVARLRFEQAGARPATRRPTAPSDGRADGRSDDPVAVALATAEGIWAERLGGDGGWRWLDVGYVPSLARVAPRTWGTGLWDGSDGIGLLLAGAASVARDVTGETARADVLASAARAVLGPDPTPVRSPWAAPAPLRPWYDTGIAGHGLVRVWAGRLLADDVLTAAGTETLVRSSALGQPSDDQDPATVPVDLVGGWSGVVAAGAAALATGAPGGDALRDATVDRARWLVAVVEAQRGALAVGATPERTLGRLGLAHGLTGVVLGLARAAALGVGEAADLAVALAAAEQERVARRGGIGGRIHGHGADRAPEATWCWGTAGHLLAHLDPAVTALVPPDAAHRERSLQVLLDQPPAQVAHLCCGRAGHLEALGAVHRGTGDERAAVAAAAAARQLARGLGAGTLAFDPEVTFASPGLMTGRAGVAWALLRHARPGVLPSVLLLR